ncbi:hypothetical protein K1Y77_17085 (plasmid) [Halomonas qaidamensis]|uniref:Mor transcription activator domain-containing protein n=1 Tax=Halomonas qaidamensis TaxID=2866211 RepID=A0ABY6JV49_9GAMM|nr:hypothetical protein [Halomonas qaidamensis]UYV20934.1 hypothetical protein K1Y77_17085 [Halomonas qaidamensis]
MGRRAANDLDDLLERWARWCLECAGAGFGTSVLGLLIDNGGIVSRSTGGTGGEPMCAQSYPLEERIEYAVVALARDDLLAADVLRLEYNAGVARVVNRRKLRGYDHRNIGQLQKAHALGVGVATYRRRLAKGRAQIETTLAL